MFVSIVRCIVVTCGSCANVLIEREYLLVVTEQVEKEDEQAHKSLGTGGVVTSDSNRLNSVPNC